MIETITNIKSKFVNLLDKIEIDSDEILTDKKYVKEMSEDLAKLYVYLNDAICEELSMCHTCAQQSDYLRDTMSMFEELSTDREVDAETINKYREFPKRVEDIIKKIDTVLLQLN